MKTRRREISLAENEVVVNFLATFDGLPDRHRHRLRPTERYFTRYTFSAWKTFRGKRLREETSSFFTRYSFYTTDWCLWMNYDDGEVGKLILRWRPGKEDVFRRDLAMMRLATP